MTHKARARDSRLIERWLPIAELGVESVRERTPMTPFPAPNRLHVWWARRPLVAARAAILASLLPANADRDKFLHAIGIHGDPVASRRRIDLAKRQGVRFEGQAYSYPRAFSYVPTKEDKEWLEDSLGGPPSNWRILDPTAGGGSIPFEALRLGTKSIANDLNPVSALLMRATVEWPAEFGEDLKSEFKELSERFVTTREWRLRDYFPGELDPDCITTNYLWARTIGCPYCEGLVPLSPNWRLAPDGTGVRLTPHLNGKSPGRRRICSFEIVHSASNISAGTVSRGDATCPYTDCGRVIDGEEIKKQAQAGGIGEQLFAVVYKRRVRTTTRTGKPREKWVREYRAPDWHDENSSEIEEALADGMEVWETHDIVPRERFPKGSNDDRPIQYGMPLWRDLFSPRQLLCHGMSVQIFHEFLITERSKGELSDVRKAAYGYLALAMDKHVNYNSRMTRWHSKREVLLGAFDRHDFSFKWSYGEMTPLVVGMDHDWAVRQTTKCIDELIALVRPEGKGSNGDLFNQGNDEEYKPPSITITCKPGDSLEHVDDETIDAVVIDPPYEANVMYAELSDFFYVWLKRTAGHIFPELFRRQLTDKESEAVANPARFRGQGPAGALAVRVSRAERNQTKGRSKTLPPQRWG